MDKSGSRINLKEDTRPSMRNSDGVNELDDTFVTSAPGAPTGRNGNGNGASMQKNAETSVGLAQPKISAFEMARMKGYEGDPCNECGQMTLVRNGTCLKCLSCGTTSGCS